MVTTVSLISSCFRAIWSTKDGVGNKYVVLKHTLASPTTRVKHQSNFSQ